MSILVTGATGYLGRYVVAELCESGAEFSTTSPFGTDLTDERDVRALLRATRPTRAIHCAAIVPKTAADYDDEGAAEASVAMVRNLAVLANCPITLASSMTAADSTTAYARGKVIAEQYMDAHEGDVIIRLPGLFGAPRQSGVLYNAALAFLTERPFELDATPSSWAAMGVRDAAWCMVSGEYNGPGLMDLMDEAVGGLLDVAGVPKAVDNGQMRGRLP